MKQWFKKQKNKDLTKQTPRPLPDIQKAYQEMSARAGALQYQIFVHNKELEQVNMALVSLNQEGAARQQLDAATTKENKDAQSQQP